MITSYCFRRIIQREPEAIKVAQRNEAIMGR